MSKRIIVLGPNVGMGGVERASANLANGLFNSGVDVTYLALIPEPHFFNLKSKYLEPIGFNQRKLSFLKTIWFIRKNVKKINPDGIICFTKFYAALANLALLFSQYKIVVTERSSPLYRWPFHVELVCRISFFLKRPKGVISQTSFASSYHKKYYGKTNYTVIPNPVKDITYYPEVKREKFILAAGRFNDSLKGFDLLIDAFNKIEATDWKLCFAGGSKEEGAYLYEKVDAPKKDAVCFLGSIKEMDRLYAKAGIFAMPSRSEGFPNALAEALCAGCCCISFDFKAGPRDLIDHSVNGIIVPDGDTSAFAESLQVLMQDELLRTKLGENAKQLMDKLNEDKIATQVFNFIKG